MGQLRISDKGLVHYFIQEASCKCFREQDLQLLGFPCTSHTFQFSTLNNKLKVWIQSEYAVEFIKGWFQSLKGLCQQIKNTQDHKCALM